MLKKKLYRINTMENCIKWEKWLKENGYKHFQNQFQYYDPEGHHIIFWKHNCDDIEVVTYKKDVQERLDKI